MLDHFDDTATDLRVLAHVVDWRALSGPEFFALALRMPYYSGVLRARLLAERDREQEAVQASANAATGEAVLAELENDGWIERG